MALLTMLAAMDKHRHPVTNVLDLKAFKMVYIAPMKALVQEVVLSFSKRLASFGITVKELSGKLCK